MRRLRNAAERLGRSNAVRNGNVGLDVVRERKANDELAARARAAEQLAIGIVGERVGVLGAFEDGKRDGGLHEKGVQLLPLRRRFTRRRLLPTERLGSGVREFQPR